MKPRYVAYAMPWVLVVVMLVGIFTDHMGLATAGAIALFGWVVLSHAAAFIWGLR